MPSLPPIIFLTSALFIIYVLVGYPLLLHLLARRFERPIRKHRLSKTVTVLLPVHNGERWIRKKLESILALEYPRELMEILVLSDGSDDRTEPIVEEFTAQDIHLLRRPHCGKAATLSFGIAQARGEILFFTDVRQPLDPQSLSNLVACFADPSVGVASGELVILKGGKHEELDVGLYWRYEKWIRKNLSRMDSVMGATGCIYAMRRELATPLPPGVLLDDVYLPLAAFFRGYRVVLEESARAFDYPFSLDSEFRRKVRTLAGVYQVIADYPALLGPSNRMWCHFTSHKLARLFVPYAFVLLAISSGSLPGVWSSLALAAQIVFYGMALTDLWVPQSSPLKRFTSPPRTFVVLMVAAVCAISIVFVPSSEFWK
jgi:biofilm PGA synthesis N-glycosyltransferase PgaC